MSGACGSLSPKNGYTCRLSVFHGGPHKNGMSEWWDADPTPASAAKHTPGPWRLAENNLADVWTDKQRTDGAGDEFVADCGPFGHQQGLAEAIANATLIAAAPALADALQRLCDVHGGFDFNGLPCALEQAHKALRAAGRLP